MDHIWEHAISLCNTGTYSVSVLMFLDIYLDIIIEYIG